MSLRAGNGEYDFGTDDDDMMSLASSHRDNGASGPAVKEEEFEMSTAEGEGAPAVKKEEFDESTNDDGDKAQAQASPVPSHAPRQKYDGSIALKKRVVVTITKPSKDATLGLVLKQHAGLVGIRVKAIRPDSLFAGTELDVGMVLERVNGQKYSSFKQCIALIKGTEGQLTIVAVAVKPLEWTLGPAVKEEETFDESTDDDGNNAQVKEEAFDESTDNDDEPKKNKRYRTETYTDRPQKRLKTTGENFAANQICLWCKCVVSPGYDKLFLLPYNRYQFWRELQHCKTWGALRALCQGEPFMSKDGDFCDMLIARYREKKRLFRSGRWDSDREEFYSVDGVDFEQYARLTDDTQVDANYGGDFDLWTCAEDDDIELAEGIFPPLIEQIMYHEANTADGGMHKWMLDYGETLHPEDCMCSNDFEPLLYIEYEKKEAVFKKIKELGCEAVHSQNLRRKFRCGYDF